MISKLIGVGVDVAVEGQTSGLKGRRKFERFTGKVGAMAAFTSPDRNSYCLCRIVNIGRGGIAIEWTPSLEENGIPPFMEIFGIQECPIWIKQVPYKIVYDCEVAADSSCKIGTRRWGIEFDGISDRQMSELDRFINEYAECG